MGLEYHTKSGKVLIEADIERLAAEAERGYDLPLQSEAQQSCRPEAAAAFSAMQAIQSGAWDRYLLRLRSALTERLQHPGWAEHIHAGELLRPDWRG